MKIGEPTEDAHRVGAGTSGDGGQASIGSRHRPLITGAGLAFGLTRPSILILLCAGTLMHLGYVVAQAASRTRLWDFSHYYVAALAMREGLNPYAIDLRPLGRQIGLDGIARATDTPFFILCFEPLTLLGPGAAYWMWFALNAAALILAMVLILRTAPPLDRRQVISLSAIMLLYPPLSNHIFFAQTQIAVLLLIVIAMRSLESGRERTAGVAIAAASLLKVFPLAVAGYFIVRRRWRACAWTLGGLLAGGAMTVLAFGVERNTSFVAATYVTRSAGFLARPANIALGSFVSRMFWYAAGTVALGPALEWTRRLTVVAAELLLVALTVYATWPRIGSAGEEAAEVVGGATRAYVVWVAAAIMLSPTAWIHYMVLLMLPFMLIAAAGWNASASPRALWLMVASYAAISLSTAIAGGAQSSLVEHSSLKIAIEECATLSLLLAYAATWFFAIDAS
jgi:hypothetical protein